MYKVSIIGLGKLGACMAAAMASKGIEVIGVDKNTACVKLFSQKQAPVFEPLLQKMLTKYGDLISATTSYDKAIDNSDITFVVVPTPSKQNGDFSLKFVLDAVKGIALALAKKSGYHIVVITSTVLPCSINSYVIPALEKYSGNKCGKDFSLCYNPEFIALGTVITNFLNPFFVLIGESDPKAGKALEGFYRRVCENKPPIARMNFVNAELVKISLNSFLTTKITFANMLCAIAQNLPGADVDVVTKALELDARIGKYYLKGGLGYGGPCFPRDNRALNSVAKRLKVSADIPQATDRFNRRIVKRLCKLIFSKIKPGLAVGILGLSYKPFSNVIEASQGFLLARELIRANIKVNLYDPLALDNVKKAFGKKAGYANYPNALVRNSDIIVIANPDPKFLALNRNGGLFTKRRRVIIDCWRILRGRKFSTYRGVEYIPFGISKT